jgi:hypothetical protein
MTISPQKRRLSDCERNPAFALQARFRNPSGSTNIRAVRSQKLRKIERPLDRIKMGKVQLCPDSMKPSGFLARVQATSPQKLIALSRTHNVKVGFDLPVSSVRHPRSDQFRKQYVHIRSIFRRLFEMQPYCIETSKIFTCPVHNVDEIEGCGPDSGDDHVHHTQTARLVGA